MNNEYKWRKRLVINCCGNNMKVTMGYYDHDRAIRIRFCSKCHKKLYTSQYANEDEKIIDENIIKKCKNELKIKED